MSLAPFAVYFGDGGKHGDRARELPPQPPLIREQGRYLADPELVEAVNVAIAVGQPLLLTGEPGCGKTRLAWSVADELELGEPLAFYTRSTSRAQDLLYRFDAVRRFYDIQRQDERAEEAHNYIHWEALGEAIRSQQRRVVLIDEVDKAPRDFPNDLLTELDRMSFSVPELGQGQRFSSIVRPIVIITSNSERQLPLPFLRRCVFHNIRFPDAKKLADIIAERLGPVIPLDSGVVSAAVERFQQVRGIPNLNKVPATGELLAWVQALTARGIAASQLKEPRLRNLPLWQALLKDREDFGRLQDA